MLEMVGMGPIMKQLCQKNKEVTEYRRVCDKSFVDVHFHTI